MLKIDLSLVISQINAHRSKVRYSFQELALMLAEKLNDPKSKSLYMKIAKHEEQELIMRAYSYTVNTLQGAENKGRFFMWKLKQLKTAEIDPLAIMLVPAWEGSDPTKDIKLGTIEAKERGNYSYICAGLTQLKEKYGNPIPLKLKKATDSITDVAYLIEDNMPFRIKNSLKTFLEDFKKDFDIKIFPQLLLYGQNKELIDKLPHEDEVITMPFMINISAPMLTNKIKQYRIPRS